MVFDISRVKQSEREKQYQKRLSFLKTNKKYTQSIEATVEETVENLFKHKSKSF